jgi:hypothetical protein
MYYFHIADGITILDDHGTKLPDLAAAREEALSVCREMVTGPDHFWEGMPWKVWVTDQPNAAGETLLEIEVSATMKAA